MGLKNKLFLAREQVREAYKNGATLRQISEVHGVSSGTVRNVLIEMGETLRSRGRRKREETVDPRVLPMNDPVDVEEEAVIVVENNDEDFDTDYVEPQNSNDDYEGGAF